MPYPLTHKITNPAPELPKPQTALLVASGDLRNSANQACWEAQNEMENQAAAAFQNLGWKLLRAHQYDPQLKHGFIHSQRHGMDIFNNFIHPEAPLVVAEAVWQYSHHVLAGLCKHRGPTLTLAKWSGKWPGLVGVLNLNGSLTKAGINYSCLWSENFNEDKIFQTKLKQWLETGKIIHDTSHVQPLDINVIPDKEKQLAEILARQLQNHNAILGVFDEGCMGMFNAIIPDHLLHPTGVFKERLSQSALFAEMLATSDREAQAVKNWLDNAGMTFKTGTNENTDLTDKQVLQQCKMYIAALRIADDFKCDAIGIQYQQGLKDCCPASDLAEGLLNNTLRPTVTSRDGSRLLYENQPLPHFNEVDECAGLDAIITNRICKAMNQPPETTLHDLRWGDYDQTGTTDKYVWVWLISGSAPPAHFINGYHGATSERQPSMYFRLGGGTLKGISKPGEVVWSRIYIENNQLNMDIGRCEIIKLPDEETRRRWNETTPQWPIMHAVTYGITRDQMMAKHRANHLNVVYATNADAADKITAAKSAMAHYLGIHVHLCGTNKNGLTLNESFSELS